LTLARFGVEIQDLGSRALAFADGFDLVILNEHRRRFADDSARLFAAHHVPYSFLDLVQPEHVALSRYERRE
jgi:hypothetical protein